MADVDIEGLQTRAPVSIINKRKKGNSTYMGPNWVHSFDGHDKLMGYQNSTFPLAVYGSINTASRKILWLRVWVLNSDARLIGQWYLEYLMKAKTISNMIGIDRNAETRIMATMHAFLR